MKTSAMSSRDRRALFLGLAVLLPSLFFIWGVRPYLAAVKDTRRQAGIERGRLSQERAAIAAARLNPGLQRVADSAMHAMTPRLFDGRAEVAGAELVSHLGEVAHDHEVFLRDATTKPATTDASGVVTLHVDIRAESDLQGLLAFLEAIEHGDKLLRVERLDVSRSVAKAEVEGVEPVAITASIVGFALRTGPAAPDSALRPRTGTQRGAQ